MRELTGLRLVLFPGRALVDGHACAVGVPVEAVGAVTAVAAVERAAGTHLTPPARLLGARTAHALLPHLARAALPRLRGPLECRQH